MRAPRIKCRTCGKIVRARKPRGGDGSVRMVEGHGHPHAFGHYCTGAFELVPVGDPRLIP